MQEIKKLNCQPYLYCVKSIKSIDPIHRHLKPMAKQKIVGTGCIMLGMISAIITGDVSASGVAFVMGIILLISKHYLFYKKVKN